jgi:hypothetical protein
VLAVVTSTVEEYMCAMDMRITEADLTGLITLGHILVLKK